MNGKQAIVQHTLDEGCFVSFDREHSSEQLVASLRSLAFVWASSQGSYKLPSTDGIAPKPEHFRKLQRVAALLRDAGFSVEDPTFDAGEQEPFAVRWATQVAELKQQIAWRREQAQKRSTEADAADRRGDGMDFIAASQPASRRSSFGRSKERIRNGMDKGRLAEAKADYHSKEAERLQKSLDEMQLPVTSTKRIAVLRKSLKEHQANAESANGTYGALLTLLIERTKDELEFHEQRLQALGLRPWDQHDFKRGDFAWIGPREAGEVVRANAKTLTIKDTDSKWPYSIVVAMTPQDDRSQRITTPPPRVAKAAEGATPVVPTLGAATTEVENPTAPIVGQGAAAEGAPVQRAPRSRSQPKAPFKVGEIISALHLHGSSLKYVTEVEPRDGGGWRLTAKDFAGEQHHYHVRSRSHEDYVGTLEDYLRTVATRPDWEEWRQATHDHVKELERLYGQEVDRTELGVEAAHDKGLLFI